MCTLLQRRGILPNQALVPDDSLGNRLFQRQPLAVLAYRGNEDLPSDRRRKVVVAIT